MPALCRNASPP